MISNIKILFLTIILVSCSEKSVDPNSAESSFIAAKKLYDDDNDEKAITMLEEFKARFPYSKLAVEAELLVANAFFKLQKFEEASYSYRQFVKMHPTNSMAPFAQFRIGESYWRISPEAINREQEYTQKALDEWKILISNYPTSKESQEAQTLIPKGEEKIAKSHEFIANFYYKKEKWHACAYRFHILSEKYPEYINNKKSSLLKAAFAFEQLAKEKNDKNNDENLYFKNFSQKDLLEKARELRLKAE